MAIPSKGQKSLASILEAKYPSLIEEDSSLPGTPDIVFREQKLALFFHGCYWHGHDCRPPRKTPFQRSILAVQKQRDRELQSQLIQMGYRVEWVWECYFKQDPEKEVERVLARLFFAELT